MFGVTNSFSAIASFPPPEYRTHHRHDELVCIARLGVGVKRQSMGLRSSAKAAEQRGGPLTMSYEHKYRCVPPSFQPFSLSCFDIQAPSSQSHIRSASLASPVSKLRHQTPHKKKTYPKCAATTVLAAPRAAVPTALSINKRIQRSLGREYFGRGRCCINPKTNM